MLKARLYDFEIKKRKKKIKVMNLQNQKLDGVIRLDLMFYNLIDLLRTIGQIMKVQIQIKC